MVDIWGVFAGGNSIDTILTVILVMAALFATWMIFRAVKMMRDYKIKVEITDLTRDRQIIRFDKAKEYQTSEGRQKVGLLKTKSRFGKANIEYPSEKFVDITERGKKFLRLKKLDVETLVPWHPAIEDEDINRQREKHATPEQKSAFINEYKQAEQYGKPSIWQMLQKAAPFITIILAVIMLVIVMDVAAEKHTEIANVNAKTAEKLADQAEESNDINKQLLEYLKSENDPPEPPKNQSVIPD